MQLQAVELVLQVLEVEVYSLNINRAENHSFVKRKPNCNCLKVFCFQINLAKKKYVVNCYGRALRGSISLCIIFIHYADFNIFSVSFKCISCKHKGTGQWF